MHTFLYIHMNNEHNRGPFWAPPVQGPPSVNVDSVVE